MDFRAYFYSLDRAQREAFARRASTTVGYIQCHLITRRKVPRPDTMRQLAAATETQVSMAELLAHFYPSGQDPIVKRTGHR